MRALELARHITNTAIRLGKPVSHMHLNVILYNMQELFKNEYSQKLIDDNFVAGRTCPVVPDVVGYFMRTFNYQKISEKEPQGVNIENFFRSDELKFISTNIKRLIDIPFLDQLEEMRNEAHAYRRALKKGENTIIPFEKIGMLTIKYLPEKNSKKTIKLKVRSTILEEVKSNIEYLVERSHIKIGKNGSIDLIADDKYERFYLIISENMDIDDIETLTANNIEAIIRVEKDDNYSVKMVEVKDILKKIQESYMIFSNYINHF